jgi:signal transduction histidine kinase
MGAEIPDDDARRVEALRDYRILDSAPEETFDNITQLATELLGMPIALVSLVDDRRQWFKSRVGLEPSETPREDAFCGHAIWQREPLQVPDATRDPRFDHNPLVVGSPHIRFYCGVPLRTPQGHGLGTLCVIDRVPRELSADQLAVLRRLARQVELELELRRRLELLGDAVKQGRQALRAKQLLGSMVVHDLRGPLTAISLGASLVRAADDESGRRLEAVIAETERVRRMLTDVLDLCLHDIDGLQPRTGLFDAAELVRETVQRLQPLARIRSQSIETIGTDRPKTIRADRELLERVLMNLVTNAFQHGRAGQVVTVELTRPSGSGLSCEVRDQCDVIDSAHRALIFEPFQRLDESVDHHVYGLGLAFCKLAVQAHGGHIEVGPGPSGGNCFRFVVPDAAR